MIQFSSDESELMNLISAVWDDHMTTEMWKRVEELLSEADIERVKFLSDFTRLHMGLEQVVSSSNAHIKAKQAIARLKASQSRSPHIKYRQLSRLSRLPLGSPSH
jgi:hypothetical protein